MIAQFERLKVIKSIPVKKSKVKVGNSIKITSSSKVIVAHEVFYVEVPNRSKVKAWKRFYEQIPFQLDEMGWGRYTIPSFAGFYKNVEIDSSLGEWMDTDEDFRDVELEGDKNLILSDESIKRYNDNFHNTPE